jgi:hypothetical protein
MDFEVPDPFSDPATLAPTSSVASTVEKYSAAVSRGQPLKTLLPAVAAINFLAGQAPLPTEAFPAVWRLGPSRGKQWGEWHPASGAALEAGA